MRNTWILLTLASAVFLSAQRRTEAARASSDDLYLDDGGSGGYYPEDDDDFNSGSGSGGGDEEEEVVVAVEAVTQGTVYIQPKDTAPTKDATKAFTPKVAAATTSDGPSDADLLREIMPRNPVRTEMPPAVSTEVRRGDAATSSPAGGSVLEPIEVRSENLFQRTEVLAAVIAGGVIGFLFAIFLILLLVYRMRKKDEGSYDLGERKPSGAAYQKAPTKEFYA
ncbi:syndecan-2 [Gadus morhua]|uniref:Syndecan n=1 Tax=Gadus morhua TaxID=8049 RepID=A0A8C5BI83_GADMO|nr:syndecan-2-like [Gadus morhua]